MATISRLKNPRLLGPFDKEHFLTIRETYAYRIEDGKHVVDRKLSSRTEVTMVECTAVFSDGTEKKLNTSTYNGVLLDAVLVGNLGATSNLSGRTPLLVAKRDLFWDANPILKDTFDDKYRIQTTATTTTTTPKPTTNTNTGTGSGPYSPDDQPQFDTPAYTAYSNGDSVNVRESPSSASSVKIIGKLDKGDTIVVSNYNSSPVGDWTRVIYKGVPAYVSSNLLSKTKPSSPSKPVPKPAQTKPESVSNLSVMNAEESFFTPVVVISGIVAIGLLAWSMWPKSTGKGPAKSPA